MKKYNTFTLYTLCFAIFLTFGCKDSGTGNSEDLKGLEQEFLTENQISDWRTKVKDVVQTDDGIVIIGSYRKPTGGCGDSVFLTKINDQGEEVWLKKFDDLTVSSCSDIHLQQTATNGFIAFAMTPLNDGSFETYQIMKFTTVGELMWTKKSNDDEIYWQINGLETGTGRIVSYSRSTSDLSSNDENEYKLTFDQNGTLESSESNKSFDGYLYDVTKTIDGNYILNIRDETSSNLIVKNGSLNTLASTQIENQHISHVTAVEGSTGGYIAQNSKSILKLDNEFNVEWKHTISDATNDKGESGAISGGNLVELDNGFYGFVEKEPHKYDGETIVTNERHFLTILNSSGKAINRQEISNGLGFHLVATDNQNILVIYKGSGLWIQGFRTSDIID